MGIARLVTVSFAVVAAVAVTSEVVRGQLAAHKFEAASVRLSPTPRVPVFQFYPDRFRTSGLPLRYVISLAFDVSPYSIVGPRWIEETAFDIEGRMPPSTPRDRGLLMLQALLEERFQMVVRKEVRPADVVVLELVDAGGNLGPHLKRVSVDCELRNGSKSPCSMRQSATSLKVSGLAWKEIPIVDVIMSQIPALVIDRTKLDGQFDVDLQWSDPLRSC